MLSPKNEILPVVSNSIYQSLLAYSTNSYDYLYEEDVRIELAYLLKQALKTNYPLQDGLSRVKTEYGKRLDIAILDSPKKPILFNNNTQLMFLYKVPVNIGIEVKLRSFDGDKIGSFSADKAKLKKLLDSSDNLSSVQTAIAIICYMKKDDFLKELADYYGDYQEWSGQTLTEGKLNCIAASPAGLFLSVE